jgi:hypothetical protein
MATGDTGFDDVTLDLVPRSRRGGDLVRLSEQTTG